MHLSLGAKQGIAPADYTISNQTHTHTHLSDGKLSHTQDTDVVFGRYESFYEILGWRHG